MSFGRRERQQYSKAASPARVLFRQTARYTVRQEGRVPLSFEFAYFGKLINLLRLHAMRIHVSILQSPR